MCFGGGGDNTAMMIHQQQQAAERAREQRIRQGQAEIDQAFEQFDDPWFDNFRQQFLDYYNPQLDRQFGDASRKTEYDLARQGLGQSSVAGDRHGELARVFSERQAEIGSQAAQAEMQQRQQVEGLRSDLFGLNQAAADPSLAAARAAAGVSGISDAPQLSPLADVFGGLFGAGQAHMAGRNQFFAPFHQTRNQSPGLSFGMPGSSMTVVR